MSATDINKMNDKQLRNEVQLLRDELAIMKRQYEDIIYNLDDDNFSSRFVKEKGDMRTAIEVNAEGIKTKVSNEEFESTKKQTADTITSEVKKLTDADNELSSKITQTAEGINSIVSEFVDVSQAVEVSSPDEFKDTNTIYAIGDTYYYYNAISQKWETVKESGMVNSLFEQTSDGFKLKGNVKIDGSCVLTDSLTFNASDKPVQVEYSVDGTTNWHTTFVSGSDKFMRLKIGSQWSDAMKIVGSDGQNGTNGTNATVTPQNVFNALTANGANQGIFAAFVNKENQIYINAEYLATKIADVQDVLYIGETGSNQEKKIQFQSGSFIKTYKDVTGNPPTGIEINASALHLALPADNIWVGSGDEAVSLEAFCGGGSGYAVFG